MSNLIESFKNAELEVSRMVKPGRYIKGRFIPGKTKKFKVTASVQQMRPDELLLLPEAQRTREMVKVYSCEVLKTGDEKARLEPDQFPYLGMIFEVHSVGNWVNFTDIPHFKSICVRIEEKGTREII